MGLEMATQIQRNVVVLRCRGRIVFGDEGAVFRERVRSELTGTSKIVIDLCSVDYIDSGGLGILVALHIAAKNRGGDIKLVSPSERVQRVLGETKLNTVFSIYESVDDAVAAFSGKVA
jgi:anti-sigma B factor antagonist